jgi:hypothetical protein
MRPTYTNHGCLSLLLAVVVASLAGCADEKETKPICPWIFDPDECLEAAEETAGDDGTGGIADGLPCSTTPGEEIRTVFQCNGSLNATIEFKTLAGDCAASVYDPALCTESHLFGAGEDDDSYEKPAVMGCCDATEPIDENFYLAACGTDMIEQFCASMPYRLQSHIDKGSFEIGKNQAQKLQNYLAENQQTCFDTFKEATTDIPGVFGRKSWLVNGGSNGDWPLLKDFTITLDDASVTSVSLPADEDDYLSCTGNHFNNTEFFEGSVPRSPGIDSIAHLTRAGTVALMAGPIVLGGRATGSATLASEASGCEDPWCSFMEVTIDRASRVWTLEELTLNADGEVALTNGDAAMGVERGSIRLYGVALGEMQIEDLLGRNARGDVLYILQPGSANFVISGMSAFASDLRWGKNATPITMHETQDGWEIGSFAIEHVDRVGARWMVSIPSTGWE